MTTPTKPHPKYRNIVFDLGGVLLVWNPKSMVKAIWEAEYADDKDIPYDLVEVCGSKLWESLDRGTITITEAIANLPVKHNKDHFAKFMREVVFQFKAIQDGIEILEAVRKKGYRTYVLSNFHEELFDKVHKQHDFFKGFDGMIVSAHVKSVKPEPAIYQRLLDEYQLLPEECLFIDDKEENVAGCPFDAVICADHSVLKQELKQRGIID